MKYLVFSDSHGTTDDMLRIMQTQPHDAVIHLGDINADVYKLRRMCFQETICAVIGNNDWFCDDIPKQIILPCRGKKIFLCHGHIYRVKAGTDLLAAEAQKNECDAALFGHTHSPCIKMEQNLLLLNPGSITYSGTYALLEINGTGIQAAIYDKRSGEQIL